MEAKHTPGPWEISRDAVPAGHVQVTVYAETGGRGTRVATVFDREANAALIAAAPDLLAAVEGLCQMSDENTFPGESDNRWKAARAAISKALDRT